MSGGKHTAGVWVPCKEDDSAFEIKSADIEYVMSVGGAGVGFPASGQGFHAECVANANRFMSCWNALQDIDSPASFREVFDELVEALAIADDLLTCDEIQSMAKKARLKGFVPDVRKVSQALAKAKEITQ